MILDVCSSTNDVAISLAIEGKGHGTWVSAKKQEQGRGRRGARWLSVEGNLFLSIILEVPKEELLSWLPLTVAVAVHDSIKKSFSKLDVEIKWPNDLWLTRKKLCGILCERVRGKEGIIVAGIGANIASSPEELNDVSVDIASVLSLSREEALVLVDRLRPVIVDSVLVWVNKLNNAGTDKIRTYYEEYSLIRKGDVIEVSGEEMDVIGLGERAELQVVKSGLLKSIYSDDQITRIRVR